MEQNWIVKINDDPYKIDRSVYIFRRFGNKIEVLNGGETRTVYEYGEAIDAKPTLMMSPEALQVLANALNDLGIKPQQGFVEGKLQATENHLKDLRKLLKLK